jgi:hypothetical protein
MELITKSFDIIYNIDWLNSINIIKIKENTILIPSTPITNLQQYIKLIDEFTKDYIYSTDSNLLNFKTEIKLYDPSYSKHRVIKYIAEYINLKYKICDSFDINYCVIINIINTSNRHNFLLLTGGKVKNLKN